MTHEEYQARLTPLENVAIGAGAPSLPTVPSSFDWRSEGVIMPVEVLYYGNLLCTLLLMFMQNQGDCGSPFVFPVVDSIDSAYAIAGGHLIGLSPYQVYVTKGGRIF